MYGSVRIISLSRPASAHDHSRMFCISKLFFVGRTFSLWTRGITYCPRLSTITVSKDKSCRKGGKWHMLVSAQHALTRLQQWVTTFPLLHLKSALVQVLHLFNSVARVATRQHLRSAARDQLTVDRSATSSQHLRSSGIRCRSLSTLCRMIYEIPLSAQQSSDDR